MAEQITISQEEYDRLRSGQQAHEKLFEIIEQLQKQVETVQAQNAEMHKQMETVQQQMDAFSLHFGRMYASQSIEETLSAMAELGTYEMQAAECHVYSVDAYNSDSMFTVDVNGERSYLLPEADSLLKQAVEQHQPFIFNDIQSHAGAELFTLGDGTSAQSLNSLLIVPLEDRNGDVIGLAVAKGKQEGFTQEDVEAFNLKDGKIGNTFRMGLENKALQQKATTDPLTHLQNREGMNQFIKQQALPHIQHGEPVSVMVFDIDKFKTFNDTYGHEIGDECLKLVANTLKENLRSSDDSSVFRWGGEEMVVIVPVDEQQAREIANRLREAVQDNPLPLANGGYAPVTVSCGIAQFETNLSYGISKGNVLNEFETAFKKADDALYFAKENGRNQVCQSQTIEDVFKGIDLSKAVVSQDNPDNIWKSDETLVAYSDISHFSDAVNEEYSKVLTAFLARVEEKEHTSDIFKSLDNVGVNFVIDKNGVSAELEEYASIGEEKGKRVPVMLTENEQSSAADAVANYMQEHGMPIPDFLQELVKPLTQEQQKVLEVLDKMSKGEDFMMNGESGTGMNEDTKAFFNTTADALESMMAVMDYVIDKNDKGQYMIFDQQTETYLENYDNSDGTYSGNTFKNAQEIVDRVWTAIEEQIIENIRDAIEDVLPSISPAKYEEAGLTPPSEVPSGSVQEIDALLKADWLLKNEMITAGYDADIKYIDLLANHIEDVNLERLFSEKWFGFVMVDDIDRDVAQYDPETKILDVRVDVADELVTELLRSTDFDFGKQERDVRSGSVLDLPEAGIEYADLYAMYHEDNSPDSFMLSLQMADGNKQYFYSHADTTKDERPMVVDENVKNAINNAVTDHFNGKDLSEVFVEIHEAETEHE